MRQLFPRNSLAVGFLFLTFCLIKAILITTDNNDPNAINSIFADIDAIPADLYDLYGFPSDETVGGEKVVIDPSPPHYDSGAM